MFTFWSRSRMEGGREGGKEGGTKTLPLGLLVCIIPLTCKQMDFFKKREEGREGGREGGGMLVSLGQSRQCQVLNTLAYA